jgi:phosphate transport system substrate-binding protein
MPETRAARSKVALLRTVLLGVLFLSGAATGGGRIPIAGTPIAVIVHPQVPVDDISLAELRRIFLGERQSWSKDLEITLLTPPLGTPEREVLLHKIYQRRSEVQYQQYWINRLFSDGASTAPKMTGSNAMSASLARDLPGAIALVAADKVPRGVKVLRIDGRLPGDANYPLVTSG